MNPTAGDHSGTARRVQAGQVELAVTQRGRGMPILLAHGFPLDHTMWEPQIEFLARRSRVIAPDLRGFGASQVVPGTATMEQLADDLVALLDALGVREPVVLCGLSMGGYVAFQFWRKYASRLRALILCDTRSRADTPEAAAARHKQAETVLGEGAGPLAEAMLPKLLAPPTIERQPRLADGLREVILSTPPEGIAAALRGLASRPDVTDMLPRISLPTLVVVGEADAISPPDEMREMAASISGSEFVVIPNSGHMSPLENPAAFSEAIEPFLARLERSG